MIDMNNYKINSLLLFLLVSFSFACTKLPEYSNIPEIELESVSTYSVSEGQDSVVITVRFTDGDGNIGARENEASDNAFFIDSRFGLPVSLYKIPYIEPSGRVKALSGTIDFTLQPFSCRPNVTNIDSFKYEIYILDRDGNQSNSIFTETFEIQCQ